MALKDIGIKIVANFKDKASKGLKTLDNAIKSSEKAQAASFEKQGVQLRNLANQNKRSFKTAALSISPVIEAYAKVAISLQVLERVWSTIDIGAKFLETSKSFEVLGKTFGFNADLMLGSLKELSGGAITAQNAMANASLAFASGIGKEQLEELTVTARKAARVMGRSMPDAFDRIVRAVTKLEPELLDEIGLTTRLQNILGDYAKSVGKSVDQITSLEKTQIFTNAVIEEGKKKFGSISVATKSWAERLETVKTKITDTSTAALSGLVPAITTILELTVQYSTQLGLIAIALGTVSASRRVNNKLANEEALANRTTINSERALLVATEELAIAQRNLAAAKASNVKIDIKLAQTELVAAKATQIHAKAQLKSEAAAISAAKGFTLAKGATRLFGRALSALTGYVGIAILIIAELVSATGLLDGVFGEAALTTEELKQHTEALSEAEQKLLIHTSALGVTTEQMIKSLEKGKVTIKDLGEGYSLLTAMVKNANGEIERHVTLRKELDGKQIDVNITGTAEQRAELQALTADLINLEKKNTGLHGFLIRLFGGVLPKKIAKLREEIHNLRTSEDGMVGGTVALEKANDRARASMFNFTELLKDTGTTIDKLDMDKLTPKEKLNKKIKAVSAAISGLTEGLPNLQKELTKAVEVLNPDDQNIPLIENLVANVNTAETIIPGLIKLLEKLKQEAAGKAKKAEIGFEEAAILRAIKALKEEKVVRFANKKSAESFAIELSDLEHKLATLKIERLRIDLKAGLISEKKFQVERLKLLQDTNIQEARNKKEAATRIRAITATGLNNIVEDDKASYAARLAALDEFTKLKLEKEGLSESEKLAIEKNAEKKREAIDNERIVKEGTLLENLKLMNRQYVEDIRGTNAIIAESFTEMADTVSKTLTKELGKTFGLVTDEAKKQLADQLQAAKSTYQDMVNSANEAFGLGAESAATDMRRALEDLERERVRRVADLTARRDRGEIDQSQFQQGIQDINIDVRRKQEDLNIGQGRDAEDRRNEKQRSLLDAQKELNNAILEANQEFADANNKVWDDMYAGIKDTAFNAIGEIMKAEFNKAVFNITAAEEQAKGETKAKSESASANLQTALVETLQQIGLDLPAIISKFTALLGPFGPPVAAVVTAGLAAAASSLVAKAIPVPQLALGSTVSEPTLPKAHSGGVLGGTGEETAFIGLKGEGVLNRELGMRAVGGERGLATANATGRLPTTQSTTNTSVTIQIIDPSTNQARDVLTIDNFEDFLRNKGGKALRNVSKDGNIIIDKKGISK